MNAYDAAERAYKNDYEKGCVDTAKKILEIICNYCGSPSCPDGGCAEFRKISELAVSNERKN